MDKICAEIVNTVYGYDELSLLVNGVPLDSYLATQTGRPELLGLYPAWGDSLMCKSECEFIWELLNQNIETINIPVLLCPDDLDLSCIVIVMKTRFHDKYVVWDNIGRVNNKKYNFIEEAHSGILNLETWTADDFKTFGNSLVGCTIDNEEYKLWISENWYEEKKRRLRNYTFKYFQNDENIDWFEVPSLKFTKSDYNSCIEAFRIALQKATEM